MKFLSNKKKDKKNLNRLNLDKLLNSELFTKTVLAFTVYIAEDTFKPFIPFTPFKQDVDTTKECNKEFSFFYISVEIFPNDAKYQERVSNLKDAFFTQIMVGSEILITDWDFQQMAFYRVPPGYIITRAICERKNII